MDGGKLAPASAAGAVLLENNSAASADEETLHNGRGVAGEAQNQMMCMQLLLARFAVFLAVISVILQLLQTTGPMTKTSQMVYMALVISSTAFVVSAYISSINKRASTVVLNVGVIFGSVAFMWAFVHNLHTPFMVASLTVYLMGIISIILAYLFSYYSVTPLRTWFGHA